VAQIKQNLASTGTNASGKTSSSLKFEVKNEGFKQVLKITGKPYFMVVETGRKATPDYKPSAQFVASIKEWMAAKGIQGQAYGIAQAIHKKGTRLHQTGGREDIVSSVVNDSLVQQISKSVLDQFAITFSKNVVNLFSDGRRIN
jgi:predicted acetyltransferase